MSKIIEKLFLFATPLHLFLFLSVLFVLVIVVFEVVKYCKSASAKDAEPVCEAPAPVEVKEEPAPVVKEEPVVEPVKEEVKAEPIVEEVAPSEDELVIGDIDDGISAKRIPFKDKILTAEDNVKSYFNAIDNAFRSYRKINPRASIKGVSYRLGRQLVAKLTIRGKTLKLHLALGINDFEQKIFFQKDMSDVKEYVEVPFTVKVRSDRALKNALKLIEALAEKHAIEKKTRFNEVDSIALLADK